MTPFLTPTLSCSSKAERTQPHGLTRRAILAGPAAAVAAAALGASYSSHAQPGTPAGAAATGPTLKVGQSVALTGPLADLGIATNQGAKAAFAEINAKGGINGLQIALTTADDGYDTKRALENASRFMADPSMFALFNCMGTPMIEAMLPLIKESGIPFFAPLTGALLSRPAGQRNVFNIRASYPEEADLQLRHLSGAGFKKIAIAYQNNAFGKEVFNTAQASIARLKLTSTATATVESNASNAAAAATQIAKSEPDAVLVFLAGKPAIDFIKAFRTLNKGVQNIYALSVMGASGSIKTLGADALGVAISQVVPLPSSTVLQVVREFQQAWKSAGMTETPSHLALEGYINGRVFAEVLARSMGKSAAAPTRAAFIDSAWGMQRHSVGGFNINFTNSGQSASRFVEMTLINREGRVIS